MAVRRWQKSRRIYVRPRTGPRSARLWWPAVAKLQAAGVPIAQAAAPWDRQTDGSRYRLLRSECGPVPYLNLMLSEFLETDPGLAGRYVVQVVKAAEELQTRERR